MMLVIEILINQWLMAQVGDVGPMLGQHHQFHHYNPGKSKFGEERYFKIAKRLYKDLDEHLENIKIFSRKKLYNCRYCNFSLDSKTSNWHDIGLK